MVEASLRDRDFYAGAYVTSPTPSQAPAIAHDLEFPGEFLALTETHCLTGAWLWHFDSDEHIWSKGCLHLLGLDPSKVRPSYQMLLKLLHPDDRDSMPTESALLEGESLPIRTMRFIRPDGTRRLLQAQTDVKLGRDGRPLSALGTLIDVTNREIYSRAQGRQDPWMRIVDAKARVLRFTFGRDQMFSFEPEAAEALGLASHCSDVNPIAFASPDHRKALRQAITDHQASGEVLFHEIVLDMPGSGCATCSVTMVPRRDEHQRHLMWYGVMQFLREIEPAERGKETQDMQALQGCHLRAARALLDWSMAELAEASRLSVSTVRRIEGGEVSALSRSRDLLILTLSKAGVQFLPSIDGSVAISRSANSSAERADGGDVCDAVGTRAVRQPLLVPAQRSGDREPGSFLP